MNRIETKHRQRMIGDRCRLIKSASTSSCSANESLSASSARLNLLSYNSVDHDLFACSYPMNDGVNDRRLQKQELQNLWQAAENNCEACCSLDKIIIGMKNSIIQQKNGMSNHKENGGDFGHDVVFVSDDSSPNDDSLIGAYDENDGEHESPASRSKSTGIGGERFGTNEGDSAKNVCRLSDENETSITIRLENVNLSKEGEDSKDEMLREKADEQDKEERDFKREENQIRMRKTSSLKMYREGDTNYAQKKIVRFADMLGLDLADVRTFLDELPSVPKSAYDDLQHGQSSSEFRFEETAPFQSTAETCFGPAFIQPVLLPNFLDKVQQNCVCLERAWVCEKPVLSIEGEVRVRNLDFEKSVYVRFSTDDWKTCGEIEANYVNDSCDGFSDKFSFVLYIYEVRHQVALVIRYCAAGATYWDNNQGSNYIFRLTSSIPTIISSAPSTSSYLDHLPSLSDSYNSFY